MAWINSLETAFFLYRSRTALDARSGECRSILRVARARNAGNGLTGYLHHEDGRFYQWLEGPAEALQHTGALIERDPRHQDLDYLWRGTQPQRQFDGWDMGFGAAKPGSLFDWVAENGVRVGDAVDFARGVLGFMQGALARGA